LSGYGVTGFRDDLAILPVARVCHLALANDYSGRLESTLVQLSNVNITF
jgi:hypothetical protein